MKLTHIFSLFCLSLVGSPLWASSVPAQSGSGETNGYKLVWQDLFDGNTLNEEDHWNIEVNGNGGGNNELQYYRRENISFGTEPQTGRNCLIITAKKENYGGKSCTSARLTTQNKMFFTHGKVEARIKLPKTADGLWPAFWLLGQDNAQVGWPRSGEIDILEMGHKDGITSGNQERLFNGACHWGYYENGWYPSYARASVAPYSLQDDFHLYTLIWDDKQLNMYLDLDVYPDAAPYYSMNITDYSDPKAVGYYFHKPYFVILNLAIGGNFPQIWDINQITALKDGEAKMYVDYVKLYQKGDDDDFFVGTALAQVEAGSDHGLIRYDVLTRDLFIDALVKYVCVYSLDGKLVKSPLGTNISSLAGEQPGIYIVRVVLSDGKKVTRKISVV